MLPPTIAAGLALPCPQRADDLDADPADAGPATGTCRDCGTPIWPKSRGVPSACRDEGRGLCRPCWRTRDAAGTLDEVERVRFSRDELMDEWVVLRDRGCSKRQAAARLGMTFARFDRALLRARAAGDPRALPPLVAPIPGRHVS